jgi:hypothetical protein
MVRACAYKLRPGLRAGDLPFVGDATGGWVRRLPVLPLLPGLPARPACSRLAGFLCSAGPDISVVGLPGACLQRSR